MRKKHSFILLGAARLDPIAYSCQQSRSMVVVVEAVNMASDILHLPSSDTSSGGVVSAATTS